MKRQRLARRRKMVGYSQEHLAEVLRVERSTVARWERAETEPQPWLRPRLAKALGISREVLAAGRELYPWRTEPAVHDVHDRLLALVARA